MNKVKIIDHKKKRNYELNLSDETVDLLKQAPEIHIVSGSCTDRHNPRFYDYTIVNF